MRRAILECPARERCFARDKSSRCVNPVNSRNGIAMSAL
jgi:hypothetical protein